MYFAVQYKYRWGMYASWMKYDNVRHETAIDAAIAMENVRSRFGADYFFRVKCM